VLSFLLALLRCERCGREEYLEHPTGNYFYCCGQRMRKETIYEEEE